MQLRERRVDASAVQGEGAYVMVRPLTYGEAKMIRQLADTMTEDEKVTLTETLIREHITGWNWSDSAGSPLPSPWEDRLVLSSLTVEEMTFLGEALHGDPNR